MVNVKLELAALTWSVHTIGRTSNFQLNFSISSGITTILDIPTIIPHALRRRRAPAMSNVLLPGALLRPSCRAAMRPSSATITSSRKAATLTGIRHSSSQHSCYDLRHIYSLPVPRRSIFAPPLQPFSFQVFTRSFHPHVPLPKSPRTTSSPNPVEKKKRQVRIGPLPCGELAPKAIESIFGCYVPPNEGNAALRILQHRRVSGSLADHGPDVSNKFRNITPALSRRGLEWLRKQFPLDEARAAEEWAEKEANRIAFEIWMSEETGGKKLADPVMAWETMEADKQAERIYQTGLLHHGPSVIEQQVKERRRQRLEEAAKRAEEKEAQEAKEAEMIASGEYVRSPGGALVIRPGQKTYVDIFGKERVDDTKEWADHYNKLSASPYKSEEEMKMANTTVCAL
jgi:rhomboid-like protein